jgi:hypothetical protein
VNENIRDTILEAMEASLDAQLNAIRRLRKTAAKAAAPRRTRGRSQMDMVYDVLVDADGPLHLSEIIARINSRFQIKVDPDSLGSALTKRVVKQGRFVRPAKNTFAIREPENAG